MTHGLIIYKPNGAVAWDSRSVKGVLFADALSLAANQSTVVSYPQFAGATVTVVNQTPTETSSNGSSTDVALGYPRVTIAPVNSNRRLKVLMEF